MSRHQPDTPHCTPDLNREQRLGFAEVVYCPGKTDEQLRTMADTLFAAHSNVIATRATPDQMALLQAVEPAVETNELGRVAYLHRDRRVIGRGTVAIVTAAAPFEA